MWMVRCKVCSIVEGREMLLVPKLDFLVKHFGLTKCTVAKPDFDFLVKHFGLTKCTVAKPDFVVS